VIARTLPLQAEFDNACHHLWTAGGETHHQLWTNPRSEFVWSSAFRRLVGALSSAIY